MSSARSRRERLERDRLGQLGRIGIDEHRLAVLLQRLELLVVLQVEPLEYEWCLGPGPVELRDVHAHLQLRDRNAFLHLCKITACCGTPGKTCPSRFRMRTLPKC